MDRIDEVKRELRGRIGYVSLMSAIGEGERYFKSLSDEERALSCCGGREYVSPTGERLSADFPSNMEERAILLAAGWVIRDKSAVKESPKENISLHDIHMEEADD